MASNISSANQNMVNTSVGYNDRLTQQNRYYNEQAARSRDDLFTSLGTITAAGIDYYNKEEEVK